MTERLVASRPTAHSQETIDSVQMGFGQDLYWE
jgi:hypothetical protein